MDNIIERAEQVASELAEFKRYNKAKQELYRIQDGRASLVLELLNVETNQVVRAIDRVDKTIDSSYTKLTSLVQGR